MYSKLCVEFSDVFSPLPFNLHLCALCCCFCSNGPRTISYPIQSQFSPYNFCLPLSSSHLHFRLELSWPELNWMKTTCIGNAFRRNLYIWMWDKQSMNRLFCTHSFWIDEWMSCVMLKIRCVFILYTRWFFVACEAILLKCDLTFVHHRLRNQPTKELRLKRIKKTTATAT